MSWSNYKAPNLGLLFYRHIYKENFVKQKLQFNDDGELIIKITKDDKPNPFNAFYDVLYAKPLKEYHKIENPQASEKFSQKTTYPGLLCGSGYAHDTGAMGDFKIGFFFDHSSGQPVIPGSSVKGVCRSVFEMDKAKKTEKKSLAAVRFVFNEILERNKEKSNYTLKVNILKILDSLSDTPENFDKSIKNLKLLIEQIFGKDKTKGSDIFFDAVLDIDHNNSNPFLANDFITPHIDKNNPELSPFKNPNPIQFLKVRSEVPFEFRFKLTDYDELWTKDVKLEFFKQILLTLGIGAKTNVGYGQFHESSHNPNNNRHSKTIPVSSNQNQHHSNPQNQIHTAKEPHKSNTLKTILKDFSKKPKMGDDIEVKVIDHEQKTGEVSIESKIHKVTIVRNCPQQGYIYRATVTQVLAQGISVKIDNHKPLLE